MRCNKETGLENAALQKFCQKKLLEQILITEYQESSLGLTLAVPPPPPPKKSDLDNMLFSSNPRIGHLHDCVVMLPESFWVLLSWQIKVFALLTLLGLPSLNMIEKRHEFWSK